MSDSQIFLLLGIFYISVSAGFFINPSFYKKLVGSFFNEPFALFLGGIAAICVGYLFIVHHNIWELSRSVVITIFGWIAFLKGIFIILTPEFFIKTSIFFRPKRYGIISGIVGIIFLILSFF